MNKFLGLGAVLALLAACDERPVETIETPIDPDNPPVLIDGVVQTGDPSLVAGSFNGGATPTLQVSLPLDGQQVLQTYVFEQTLDDGFALFTRQEGSNGRFFRAIGGESADGNINGVVVQDGGQFNRFFGGAFINQESFSEPGIDSNPDAGNLRYTGTYYGLLNFGPTRPGPGLPGGGGSGEAVIPFTITGDVFLIADFTGDKVNGQIYNRIREGGVAYEDVVLTPADILADGSFSGDAEFDDVDLTNIGTFSGAFGGNGATSVGGVLNLDPPFLDGSGDTGNGNENEFGIFILDLTPDNPI